LGKHVALVEPNYYSQFPPIGLLKLSTYHRMQGDTTELLRKSAVPKKYPDIVHITSLFTWAWKPVWTAVRFYKTWYSNAEVSLGGLYASLLPDHARLSGADFVYTGLFKEAEDLMPDYSLVPKWMSSIIFSSRGCNRKCPYCAVPRLEGQICNSKKSIKHLVWPGHTNIVLFDNNILASPTWKDIFDELIEMQLKVDFNQGLDARLLTEEAAEIISQMKTHTIRLGYDTENVGKSVKRAIDLLESKGISKREILVYALYNFTDSPDSFYERVKDVLNWGAACYPMRFEPLNTLKKNTFVSKKWTRELLDLVQRARRVIGYGGAFPPYKGLVNKFNRAESFEEAFSLYPEKRTRTTLTIKQQNPCNRNQYQLGTSRAE